MTERHEIAARGLGMNMQTIQRKRMSLAAAVALVMLAVPAVAQQAATPAYVGSESCTDCHTDEAAAWKGSHHQLAWTPPDADHILADFEGTTFTHQGVTSTFTREGETFFIESDGPDGTLQRWPVAGVAGIAPLQQYLIETTPGTLQSFDVVWDVEEERWYHLYPDQVLRGDDGLHWTGPYKNWNARCAECHATGFEKNYSPVTRTYSSTQSEIGVGCEACHGPGEAHIEWATTQVAPDPSVWSGVGATGMTMDFTATEAGIQQCATCHSRREPWLNGNPIPGTPFHDAYRLSTLREGLYHADGQILDEVYVYGSFLQSKMYAQGVGCMDCHDPHTATRIAEGNALCVQCHSPAGNPRFETLKKAEYDSPEHHFHEAGTEGAQCVNCHMIERDYMGIDGRRDHSFRVPRPDLSVETRAPNACTDCHTDQSARWAADAVEQWYPDSIHRGPHFAQVFAAERRSRGSDVDGLLGIAELTSLPAIVRATAMDMLAMRATPEIAARLAPLVKDPDPLVRVEALRLQRAAAPTDSVYILAEALADPVRSVRTAAAREFLSLPLARLPAAIQADLDQAMGEWQNSIAFNADFPEIQIVLAGVSLTTRDFQGAVRAFEEAVALDPQLVQAWTMIIRIHAALGDRDSAISAADRAIAANPESVELNLLRADIP
jgi:hypothetical protein